MLKQLLEDDESVVVHCTSILDCQQRLSIQGYRHAMDSPDSSDRRQKLLEEFGDVWVTRTDSVDAHNCDVGTDNFIEQHFPGRTRVRVRDLLNQQNDFYVQAACLQAIARTKAAK